VGKGREKRFLPAKQRIGKKTDLPLLIKKGRAYEHVSMSGKKGEACRLQGKEKSAATTKLEGKGEEGFLPNGIENHTKERTETKKKESRLAGLG